MFFISRNPLVIFINIFEYYSLCFFDESYRQALNICGTQSGRDIDKDAVCGLTCEFWTSPSGDKIPYYKEASLVLLCRKLYGQFLTADSLTDVSIYERNYPEADLHKMYIGEILEVLEA